MTSQKGFPSQLEILKSGLKKSNGRYEYYCWRVLSLPPTPKKSKKYSKARSYFLGGPIEFNVVESQFTDTLVLLDYLHQLDYRDYSDYRDNT